MSTARRTASSMTIISLSLISLPSSAQTTRLASISTLGTQGDQHSSDPSISADGSLVAFEGSSSTLVPGDTNGFYDVFVRDIIAGTTVRVSVADDGSQGNGNSLSPAISGNGRFVAFTSTATGLVANDTNGKQDVFVFDRILNHVSRVSTGALGQQADGDSVDPAISADGRYVAFPSTSATLVLADTNGATDIFVKDTLTGALSRISVDSSGNQANGESFSVSLSADGRYVAFCSSASNLVPGDTNGSPDAFVYDQFSATVQRVSVTSVGAQGTGGSTLVARVSQNGDRVVFWSYANNLVPGDTNLTGDIFVRTLSTSTTQRISLDYAGAQVLLDSTFPSISGDGRYIAYTSSSSIIPGGGGAFIFDTQMGTVLRGGTASGGLNGGSSAALALSGDGSRLAFTSAATDIVAADTNGKSDVFWSDLAGPPYAAFCFGDGNGTPCPCGNGSPVGQMAGCINSTGFAAQLSGSGLPSVSSDSLVITGTGMPLGGPCLYYQGTAMFNGGLGAVFGDGLRCSGGAIVRFSVVFNSAAGSSTYPDGVTPHIALAGGCTVGVTRTYQGWYRDSATFCAPETFNLTNGLALAWRP